MFLFIRLFLLYFYFFLFFHLYWYLLSHIWRGFFYLFFRSIRFKLLSKWEVRVLDEFFFAIWILFLIIIIQFVLIFFIFPLNLSAFLFVFEFWLKLAFSLLLETVFIGVGEYQFLLIVVSFHMEMVPIFWQVSYIISFQFLFKGQQFLEERSSHFKTRLFSIEEF